MAADFSALSAEVARAQTVNASAIALLNGIAARIDAAVTADNLDDNSASAALAASLKAETDGLASAVEANTPAAPPTA